MTIEDFEIIKQIYEAFAHQDLEGLLTLVDPECVVTQDASLPWGGRHVGHDGVTAFALMGSIDSAVIVESLFEADGQVSQCDRSKGTVRANDNAFDIPEVHTWTLKMERSWLPTLPLIPQRCWRRWHDILGWRDVYGVVAWVPV
jgi:hypothetical protein